MIVGDFTVLSVVVVGRVGVVGVVEVGVMGVFFQDSRRYLGIVACYLMRSAIYQAITQRGLSYSSNSSWNFYDLPPTRLLYYPTSYRGWIDTIMASSHSQPHSLSYPSSQISAQAA